MNDNLKNLLRNNDEAFWPELARASVAASSFQDLILLSNLRKKAEAAKCPGAQADSPSIRVALIGGSTLYPLSELIEHLVRVRIGPVEVFTGDFNNYRAEISDPFSELYAFRPDFVVIVPDERSCHYTGKITDAKEDVDAVVDQQVSELLDLCANLRDRSTAEVMLCNYLPPANFDLGQAQVKFPASDWNFRKAVNSAIANQAPNYVLICDLEFLAYRSGGLSARDDRAWFETKQLCSPALQARIAAEIAHLIGSVRTTPKKILVLDLDNTLWGGVVGDDGIGGIEIGDTSPRGEAFKAFQTYIASLIDRGVLLAVSSKNDYENAIEPFRVHPEMVLREEHFVSFKANWEPKAANLIEMAEELSLGLDSFVFVDDNPAEIEIVQQFAPEVATILLSDDPAEYVRQLQESRLFERSAITSEDVERTQQYRNEANRRSLAKTAVDMDSYLHSLEMAATIRDFNRLDVTRIAQLINKSNQFNLTTKRRSEAQIDSLMRDSEYSGFTVRLSDRFGDHGLISIVICRVSGHALEIDTWLMSCRVLKRQVEYEVLNEIVRRARLLGCTSIRGSYLPTAKNGMVRDLLPLMGFETVTSSAESTEFELSVCEFTPLFTHIDVTVDNIAHGIKKSGNIGTASVNI